MKKIIKSCLFLWASLFILSTGAVASNELIRVPSVEDEEYGQRLRPIFRHRKSLSLDDELLNKRRSNSFGIYYSILYPKADAAPEMKPYYSGMPMEDYRGRRPYIHRDSPPMVDEYIPYPTSIEDSRKATASHHSGMPYPLNEKGCRYAPTAHEEKDQEKQMIDCHYEIQQEQLEWDIGSFNWVPASAQSHRKDN